MCQHVCGRYLDDTTAAISLMHHPTEGYGTITLLYAIKGLPSTSLLMSPMDQCAGLPSCQSRCTANSRQPMVLQPRFNCDAAPIVAPDACKMLGKSGSIHARCLQKLHHL